MNGPAVLAALAGLGFGAGVLLLAYAVTPVGRDAGPGALDRARAWAAGRGGRQLLAAAAAGGVVLVATRWVVLAAAAAAMVAAWPRLFGAAAEQRRAIARLEGLAAWVEALRDTIATGSALPEAIPAASQRAHPAVARPLADVTSRMRAREPLERVLRRLADDLDDPVADQAISALLLNARIQGRQLRTVLTGLAASTRRQVDARRQVEADRRSVRRGVQIIMVVTAGITVGMAVFARDYAAPYGTAAGQLVLLAVVALFAAGFAWMRRLATYRTAGRFLCGPAGRAGAGSGA